MNVSKYNIDEKKLGIKDQHFFFFFFANESHGHTMSAGCKLVAGRHCEHRAIYNQICVKSNTYSKYKTASLSISLLSVCLLKLKVE